MTMNTSSDKPRDKREWWIDLCEIQDECALVGDAYNRHPGQGPLSWQNGLIRTIEYSAYEKLKAQLNVAMEALKTANTYLRDISELKRQNVHGSNGIASIHEIYEFAQKVARNGFNDSSQALAQIGGME